MNSFFYYLSLLLIGIFLGAGAKAFLVLPISPPSIVAEAAKREKELTRDALQQGYGKNPFNIRNFFDSKDEALETRATEVARQFMGKKKSQDYLGNYEACGGKKSFLFRINKTSTQSIRLDEGGANNEAIALLEDPSHQNEFYTYHPAHNALFLFDSFLANDKCAAKYLHVRTEFPLEKNKFRARVFGWDVDKRAWEIIAPIRWKEIDRKESESLLKDWRTKK